MRKAIILFTLGLLGIASVKAQEGPADRLNIVLENVRFQALPREVRRVHVGPDGRIWFSLDPAQFDPARTAIDNIPAFKKRMAREFTEKSPQFFGADLALFEPGGRVWFFLPQHCLLLGYDGKDWLDYVIPDTRDRVVGCCPTRGGFTAGRANRFAQGAAWFVCARSVLRFDGQNWSNQPLSGKLGQNPGNILLVASSDGRTVAACQTTSPTEPAKYWLFQQGRWESRQASAADPRNPGGNRRLMSMALGDAHTLWLVFSNGQLECENLGGEDPPDAAQDVTELIKLLADDAFATRQRAMRELLALGPSIKPQVEKALKGQPDAEQDYRLKLILQSFLPKRAAPGLPASSEIGGVRVMAARQLFQDAAGKVGVIAQSVCDRQSRQGPGVAVLDGNKPAQVIFAKNLANRSLAYQIENLPVAADSGRHAWWPRNLIGETVQLHDSEIDDFIDAAPMPLYGSVQAVSAEGRVFLAKFAAANPGERIMVYTPGAPETRTILKMEKKPVMFPQFALTDDGAVWAFEREEATLRRAGSWGAKLVRYDGKSWTAPDVQPTQMPQSMTPGKGGVLLVQTPMESILYRGEKQIATGDLVDLIEKQREVFQKSFGPDMPPAAYDTNARQANQIAADKAGNIWRLDESGRLLALVGNRWLLAHEALVAAGSPAGTVSQIMLLGDGQKIYGCDRNGNADRLPGFFGEVKDGKLHFSQAPKIEIPVGQSLDIREADGSHWAASYLKDPKGVMRQYAVLLGTEGIREKLGPGGCPLLVDAAGNLWLMEKNFAPGGCTFKLWRKGEWGPEITVPNISRCFPPFSDRPGSVYVWTTLGLQQLVADPPEGNKYQLGQLYSIDELSGEVQTIAYNKQGYVVLLMQGGSNNSPYTLGIVKLPEKP
jgi:hypothetical protein